MTRPAPSWDDLALFTAVARTGTLAAAATQTGLSTATLSRRMTALEAQLGRRLFAHGAAGYALTEAGTQLLASTAQMEAAAADIALWQQDSPAQRPVRISAGSWTATRLAQAVATYWSADALWVPELIRADLDLDLPRREVDIGIRNRRPEQPWLAGRRTARITYAAYGLPGVEGWICASGEAGQTPSSRWILTTNGADLVRRVNDPRLALDLARAGLGRVVLPTFIGARCGLPRLGEPIEALTHDEWLVSHHEARHQPHIRAALDALADFLSAAEAP